MKIPALEIDQTSSDPGNAPKLDDTGVEVFRDAAGRVTFRCWGRGDELWVEVPRVGRFRQAADGAPVVGLPMESCGPDLLRATFHRIALPMMIQARGHEVLHGSAVRTSAGVAAFCADAGTGKSTTAVALRRRGYEIWADDAVAIAVGDRDLQTVRLPFAIRVAAETARFFDQGQPPRPIDSAGGSAREGDSAPLRAIFLLERQSGQGEVVRRLDHVTALPALLEQAFCFELARAERKRRMSRNYLTLATRVPVYRLAFEPGLERIDRVLDAVEAAIRGHPAPE